MPNRRFRDTGQVDILEACSMHTQDTLACDFDLQVILACRQISHRRWCRGHSNVEAIAKRASKAPFIMRLGRFSAAKTDKV